MAQQIIIPRIHRADSKFTKQDQMVEEAVRSGMIPLRIKCPECSKIYTLFIKDFDQGISCILGQACPFCKRFIKEKDDPKDLLVDAKEIREMMKKANEGNKNG